MKFYRKKRCAYLDQRRRAIKRGIAWEFVFEEWVEWWEDNLGEDWLWKRGAYRNQYVMARYYDDGPYAAYNVKCTTARRNIAEIQRNKRLKATRLPTPI